jgi:hypothetical protein
VVVPSLKVTEPVGVPPAADATVAVNVTACPKVEGFTEDVRDVVVVAGAASAVRSRADP